MKIATMARFAWEEGDMKEVEEFVNWSLDANQTGTAIGLESNT